MLVLKVFSLMLRVMGLTYSFAILVLICAVWCPESVKKKRRGDHFLLHFDIIHRPPPKIRHCTYFECNYFNSDLGVSERDSASANFSFYRPFLSPFIEHTTLPTFFFLLSPNFSTKQFREHENRMKLVKQFIEKDKSGYVTLIPEEFEDMWHVYNLIQKHDQLRAVTIRYVSAKLLFISHLKTLAHCSLQGEILLMTAPPHSAFYCFLL